MGKSWLRVLLLCAVLLAIPSHAWPQFAAEPQAQTPEEFDAYLIVLGKASPKEIINAGIDFTRNWPHSGLCAHVFAMEMNAYSALDKPTFAIQAGEKALQGAPDNLEVLAQLAYILADSSSSSEGLARAQELAHKEIEAAKTMRLPKSISPSQWGQLQGQFGSTAHSALGLVAYKRGNLAEAIQEFETATKMAPAPDPTLYYRLGLLYKVRGSFKEAAEEFREAADLNDPRVQRLATVQLKSLQTASSKP